jgi:hypothetical protein
MRRRDAQRAPGSVALGIQGGDADEVVHRAGHQEPGSVALQTDVAQLASTGDEVRAAGPTESSRCPSRRTNTCLGSWGIDPSASAPSAATASAKSTLTARWPGSRLTPGSEALRQAGGRCAAASKAVAE